VVSVVRASHGAVSSIRGRRSAGSAARGVAAGSPRAASEATWMASCGDRPLGFSTRRPFRPPTCLGCRMDSPRCAWPALGSATPPVPHKQDTALRWLPLDAGPPARIASDYIAFGAKAVTTRRTWSVARAMGRGGSGRLVSGHELVAFPGAIATTCRCRLPRMMTTQRRRRAQAPTLTPSAESGLALYRPARPKLRRRGRSAAETNRMLNGRSG
jgi:hypothetical protein